MELRGLLLRLDGTEPAGRLSRLLRQSLCVFCCCSCAARHRMLRLCLAQGRAATGYSMAAGIDCACMQLNCCCCRCILLGGRFEAGARNNSSSSRGSSVCTEAVVCGLGKRPSVGKSQKEITLTQLAKQKGRILFGRVQICCGLAQSALNRCQFGVE